MKKETLQIRKDKAQYWCKHIESWRESSLSQVDYCRINDLPIKNFGYWKKRSSQGKPEKQIFYPLIASEMKQINPLSSPLILPVKRFRIEIGEDFSPSALKKLIVTLEQL